MRRQNFRHTTNNFMRSHDFGYPPVISYNANILCICWYFRRALIFYDFAWFCCCKYLCIFSVFIMHLSMRQYFWHNCFNLRFKINVVVRIIWSIVIIINFVLTLYVSTPSLSHDREPCEIKVVFNHTCSLHTWVCAGSRRRRLRLSGFQRKGIASLLGVSQVTLFQSGSVPNTCEILFSWIVFIHRMVCSWKENADGQVKLQKQFGAHALVKKLPIIWPVLSRNWITIFTGKQHVQTTNKSSLPWSATFPTPSVLFLTPCGYRDFWFIKHTDAHITGIV
jgi:hypothetical protein